MKNTMLNTLSIKTKEQFRAVLEQRMKKEQFQMLSVTITADDFGNLGARVELTRSGFSRVYNNAVMNDKQLKMRDGSKIVLLDEHEFSYTFVSITIDDTAKEYAKELLGGTIYLAKNVNGWVSVYSDLNSKDGYYDFKAKNNVDVLPNLEIHAYKGLTWTASNKRQKSETLMESTNGDVRYETLNNTSLGALDIIKAKYGDNLANYFENIQKDFGYLGNLMTPSLNFFKVPGYVRYYAKWVNDTNETFLSESYLEARKAIRDARALGKEQAVIDDLIEKANKIKSVKNTLLKGADTNDGQMYINARVFVDMVKKFLNIDIPVDAVIGMMIQLRPATIKASAIIVPEEVFLAKVAGTKNMARKEGGTILHLDENSANDINGHSVVTVGDKDNLLYIADKDCVKLDYNMFQDVTLEILAFAKCSTGKTSKQLAETILFAAQNCGKDGAALLIDLLRITIDNKLAEITTDRKARILTPEEIEEAAKTGYINNAVLAIAPSIIKESKALFNSVWRQAINSICNIIDSMNAGIVSHNRRLASDPTFIITGGKLRGILNFGEIFINNRKVSKVAMIKYPKMGLREFYFANNVGLKTIKARANFFVKKGVITSVQCDLIVRFFETLDSFVALLPAKTVIANACAGLDFDYDGALFIEYTKNPKEEVQVLTNQIIDILEAQKMKAVVIDSSKLTIDTDSDLGKLIGKVFEELEAIKNK